MKFISLGLYITLAVLLLSCEKKQASKLDAQYIETLSLSDSISVDLLKTHLERKKRGQLTPMKADLLPTVGIDFPDYSWSVELDADSITQHKLVFDYTSDDTAKTSYASISIKLNDYNGQPAAFVHNLLQTKGQLKEPKIEDIQEVESAIKIEEGNKIYVYAFDRFVLEVEVIGTTQAPVTALVNRFLKEGLAPFRLLAYPEIKNKELLGDWKLKKMEYAEGMQPTDPMQAAIYDGMIKQSLDKVTYRFSPNSYAYILSDGEVNDSSAFFEKSDTTYIYFGGIQQKLYQTKEKEYRLIGEPFIFHLEKKQGVDTI